jgi:hypothetical protein
LNSGKGYDLVEKIKNTPTKISLWDLIHNSPNYHTILHTALQKNLVPLSTNVSDVAALIHGMNLVNVEINFHQHELPPLEMRNKNDAFMIISIYNRLGIKRTLVDNRSTLNVCSVTLLDRFGMDKSRIEPNSLSI